MMAVMDKGVNGLIGDAAINTIQMRAGTLRAFGGKYLFCATLAFELRIGNDLVIAEKGPQVSGDEIGLQGRQLGIALSSHWCGIG